jgi:DNA-binding transcriptional regulator YiaG
MSESRSESDMMQTTMANHPNRGRGQHPAANPKPAEIKAAREAAGLSQTAAAELIYSTLRTWQDWEGGLRRMHPQLWEAWRFKVDQPELWQLWRDAAAGGKKRSS